MPEWLQMLLATLALFALLAWSGGPDNNYPGSK